MKPSSGSTTALRDAAEILEAPATASSDELVRTCRQLATERARYYHLFASSRDACVVTDAKGVIRDANERAGEMLGMSPSALRGKLLIAFVARGDTRAFRHHLGSLATIAAGGCPIRMRMRARGGAPFEATMWIDGGRRAVSDEPVSYRWTMQVQPRGVADESGLLDVLGVVAMLASRAGIEAAGAAAVGGTPGVGGLVARAIQRKSALTEQRRVRFVVEGGELPDHVRADAQRLEQSIDTLLHAALGAAPDGAELHIRLDRRGNDTVLDVHVEDVDTGSFGSPLSVVHLAARLALDGGRLELSSRPLVRVSWPAVG